MYTGQSSIQLLKNNMYTGQSSIQLAIWSTTGHGLAVVANYSLYYSDKQDWFMVLVQEREDNMVRVGVPDLLYQGKESWVTFDCQPSLFSIL